MAWRCSGSSNEELIDNLKDSGIISNERVISAMKSVDRKYYTSSPYIDSPQSIGYGATISAPHMHGYALEYLADYLKPGNKVLDVGSGSGYLTACMAAMVAPEGKAVGIEHVPQLAEMSNKNINKSNLDPSIKKSIKIICGDGRLGYKEDSPYDCMQVFKISFLHVGAASPVEPKMILDQLKSPGRLFIPVGDYSQEILMYTKDSSGKITKEPLMGVIYVPLTDLDQQISK
ncbi:hypothetical protein BB559_002065 [Furculomyces boomerangus]|uniref:protein-L-isoaspartate(D-aspartate) O-methyltransferase n=1 Tax=Furculomyces boomerangus TaxID=61424 RepID=A0A2T9YYF5_9FUNG|nr:hypothetical protein BB559_002065 [Furculomyces boomerangus]